MVEGGYGGAAVLPEKLKNSLTRWNGMGTVTFRSLPAWGPTTTQALRGRAFLMFTAASTVPRTDKVLNRELVNEARKMGTCAL